MQNTRLALFLSPLLLAATCEEAPSSQQPIYDHGVESIREWKARGHWHNPACTAFKLYLHPVPQRDLNAVCGGAEKLWACLVGNDIYMATEIWNTVRADYVVEHELRHWHSGCTYGAVDGAHANDSIWYPYRGVDIRY